VGARRIAFTTFSQITGKFLGFFVSSFFLVILASQLGTTGMGYYTTITSFLAFFMILADLGISAVMIREIAQNPERREQLSGDFLGLRISYGLLIMALAPLVALLVPQYRGIIATGVLIAAVGQFLLLVNQAYVSILQVNIQLDRAVFAEILNRLTVLALVVWGVGHWEAGDPFLIYVLWAGVAGSLVNLVLCYYFAARLWRAVPNWRWRRWWELMLLVLPMGVFNFLGMVHFRSDTILLSLLKSPADVGIYGYAYKLGEILLSIPMMFIGVVYPKLSVLYKESRAEFHAFAQKTFTALALLTFPLVTLIYSLAPYLTTLLSRQSFADGLAAAGVLRVLCLAMLAWYFGALYKNILLVGSEYAGLIRNMGIAVVLNLVLNLIFIPRYSYTAAAWVTVVTEVLMLVLTVGFVRRVAGFQERYTGFLPIMAGSGVMLAVLAGVQRLGPDLAYFAQASRLYQLEVLTVLGGVGSLAYVGVLLLWGRHSPLWIYLQMLARPARSRNTAMEEGHE
jgi:O-antigen/teichoic acid export membrane protein